MKIVFIGDVYFSEKVLEKLVLMNMDIIHVFTSKTKINSDASDILKFCREKDLTATAIDRISDLENIETIKSLNPDIIFCIGYSRLLPKEILEIPSLGVVGYHPALLPKNRGRHPLIWAIVLGLNKAGSTFFWMRESADAGPIISQEEVLINTDDYAVDLYNKIVNIGIKQVEYFTPLLEQGEKLGTEQDESIANSWRKRSKPDGEIDWRMPSMGIYNLVRALSKPYPGAHFIHKGKEIKVWKSKVIETENVKNIETGKILKVSDNEIIVKTGDGSICLQNLDPKIILKEGDYL